MPSTAKHIILVITLCLSSASLAATVTGLVGEVYVTGDGGLQFSLDGAPALCTGTGSSNAVATPGATSPTQSADAIRNWVSILLSAKLAGKQVTVTTQNPTSWGCPVVNIRIP